MTEDTQKKVIMYSTTTCHYCHRVKEFFKKNNIEFTDHDVTTDPVARKEMIDTSGQMGVPVVVIGDNVVVGFNESVLRDLLGI